MNCDCQTEQTTRKFSYLSWADVLKKDRVRYDIMQWNNVYFSSYQSICALFVFVANQFVSCE